MRERVFSGAGLETLGPIRILEAFELAAAATPSPSHTTVISTGLPFSPCH